MRYLNIDYMPTLIFSVWPEEGIPGLSGPSCDIFTLFACPAPRPPKLSYLSLETEKNVQSCGHERKLCLSTFARGEHSQNMYARRSQPNKLTRRGGL